VLFRSVNLREALKTVELHSLELEVPACELYNSIAQMMIMKHRQWHAKKKERLKAEATKFVETPEGQAEVEQESKILRRKAKEHGNTLNLEQAYLKAVSIITKRKVKTLATQESDPTTPSLVAAYRYLVMSHQVVERVHGQFHPCVGAACLAVASVQNVSGQLEEARDWLVKALRVMDRLNPPPVRAIAFVQVQLSQILAKQGIVEEAMEVLRDAVAFHLRVSEEALAAQIAHERVKIILPLPLGHPALEDVKTCLTLMEKLAEMLTELDMGVEAVQCSDKMGELADNAFGWDSREVALCRKEVGLRHVKAEDWRGACTSFKKSLDAHEACFGEKDPRSLEVCQLLLVATNHYNSERLEKMQKNEMDALF